MMLLQRLTSTDAPPAVILIRLIVGGVFLSEGIQKFLFPEALGVGRFVKIGIPAPAVMAPFVGYCEIICGALILLGLLTRAAALPLIIDMLVAISTTKIPLLFTVGSGRWSMRRAWTMPCSSVYSSCSSSVKPSDTVPFQEGRNWAGYGLMKV